MSPQPATCEHTGKSITVDLDAEGLSTEDRAALSAAAETGEVTHAQVRGACPVCSLRATCELYAKAETLVGKLELERGHNISAVDVVRGGTIMITCEETGEAILDQVELGELDDTVLGVIGEIRSAAVTDAGLQITAGRVKCSHCPHKQNCDGVSARDHRAAAYRTARGENMITERPQFPTPST